MKKYVKPELRDYDMAPVSIMEGSVTFKGKICVSTFFTDEDDRRSDEETGQKKYNFWE